jgi:prepilin-type N-terminal cleavage/methylation domain-containing protein
MKTKRRGFTLIELLVVIAIIAHDHRKQLFRNGAIGWPCAHLLLQLHKRERCERDLQFSSRYRRCGDVRRLGPHDQRGHQRHRVFQAALLPGTSAGDGQLLMPDRHCGAGEHTSVHPPPRPVIKCWR